MSKGLSAAALIGVVLLLAGEGRAQAPASASGGSLRTCPAALPKDAVCRAGRDANGAFYWTAMPARWSGVLVVHAHGGPRTKAPEIDDPVEDLERFAFVVKEGHAWTGSTYRRGGYGVRMAAEDTDNLRRLVWSRIGRPKRTILHGQSWGANVAAKAAELHALDVEGRPNYDGVFLTSGVLAGGTRAYQFRADLRAVYQFYCRNHPRPNEPQYPLWRGLPPGSALTRRDLEARVQACTGAGLPPRARSPAQTRALRDILAVTGVAEAQLVSHLAWGTFLFDDLVGERLDGRNPFSNEGVRYTGSSDDAVLNAGVQRFTADPLAVAMLAYDSDLSGLIVLPTVTLHGKGDPTAFVEQEASYRDTVTAAGRSALLLQTFTNESEHSKLSTPQYVAALAALLDWIERGVRPTPADVAARCAYAAPAYGEPCRFDPAFVPRHPTNAAALSSGAGDGTSTPG